LGYTDQVISIHTAFMPGARAGIEGEKRRARAKRKNSCSAILWRQRRGAAFLSHLARIVDTTIGFAAYHLNNQSAPAC
jgi:hypothetical protein